MRSRRLLVLVSASALLAAAVGAVGADAAADPNVPEQAIKSIDSLFDFERLPRSEQGRQAMLKEQMGKVLARGAELEKKHPGAPNLHLVQVRMLKAADLLVRSEKNTEEIAKRLAIARRLMASNAPPDSKVTADHFITLHRVKPAGGPPAKDADAQVRAYAQRYAKTDAASMALLRGAYLARELKLPAVEKEMLDALQKDHARDPAAYWFLRRAGRRLPFYADLTLLDGRKLKLPDDLLGKVVVIHFWAMGSPPCRAALPYMKQVYAKVKSRGVEFVGVSLDRGDAKDQLVQFVKDNDLPWLHGYSGKAWADPTARQYEVRGIPSLWVVARDGAIFSENARGDLEGTIDRALAAPAPKAGKAK
jgi:thiol-disulfide isomerase/thioredoxin